MGKTLNKDGTPRKIGSGKTKGAGCFAKIKWEQLNQFISPQEEIIVSRVWLRSVGALSRKKVSTPKTPTKTSQSGSKRLAIPQKQNSSEPPITPPRKTESTSKDIDETIEEEDYSPPVFANFGQINRY